MFMVSSTLQQSEDHNVPCRLLPCRHVRQTQSHHPAVFLAARELEISRAGQLYLLHDVPNIALILLRWILDCMIIQQTTRLAQFVPQWTYRSLKIADLVPLLRDLSATCRSLPAPSARGLSSYRDQ